MERALLQGGREAERALLQKEQKAVDQLQEKLVTLETGIQKERDKVTHSWPGPVLAASGPRGRTNVFSGPLTSHLLSLPTGLVVSVPFGGGGTLSSAEGVSLKGTGRGRTGFWDLLCLGLCAASGCLPVPGPPRKCRSCCLGSERSLRDRCWGVTRVWVPLSRERAPPSMPRVLRM